MKDPWDFSEVYTGLRDFARAIRCSVIEFHIMPAVDDLMDVTISRPPRRESEIRFDQARQSNMHRHGIGRELQSVSRREPQDVGSRGAECRRGFRRTRVREGDIARPLHFAPLDG